MVPPSIEIEPVLPRADAEDNNKVPASISTPPVKLLVPLKFTTFAPCLISLPVPDTSLVRLILALELSNVTDVFTSIVPIFMVLEVMDSVSTLLTSPVLIVAAPITAFVTPLTVPSVAVTVCTSMPARDDTLPALNVEVSIVRLCAPVPLIASEKLTVAVGLVMITFWPSVTAPVK